MRTASVFSIPLLISLLCACPSPPPEPTPAPTTDAGNAGDDAGVLADAGDQGEDAGIEEDAGAPPVDAGSVGPAIGWAELHSDGGLDFPVRSTVLHNRASGYDFIYLYESDAGRDAFCNVEMPSGRIVSLSHPDVDDGGTTTFSLVSIRYPDGSGLTATTSSVTVTVTSPPERAAVGHFEASDFSTFPSGPPPGSLSGTFEAHPCPSRPYFDGGSGPNSASGTLGFEVRTAVGFHQGAQYDLYLLSAELPDGGCSSLGSLTDSDLLRLAFERTGTGETETFMVNPLTISKWRVLEDGGYSNPLFHADEGTLVAHFTDGGVFGTYEGKFVGQNGAAEDIHGTFDPVICDQP